MLGRARFEAVPHPVANARVLDVHELGADRLRVNGFEARDHFAQRHAGAIEEELRGNREIEILLAKAEFAQSEERILRALFGQRIQLRDGVAERAVGIDEAIDARREEARRAIGVRGRGGGGAVALLQIAQLEPLEKRRPTSVHRFGILLPAAVVFLEQGEVGTGRKGGAHDGSQGAIAPWERQVDSAEAGSLLPLMTAAQVYDSVTNGGARDFAEAVAILDRHGPWCLIGGLAVNHYVEPVYTIDADLVLVADNRDAVAAALLSAGFSVKAFPHSINARKPASKLVLQFTTEERYQSFVERAERGEALGCTVPIASLPDLIQGKIWAWQDSSRRLSKHKKDELDLIRIAETYPELRHLIPGEIISQIEERSSDG